MAGTYGRAGVRLVRKEKRIPVSWPREVCYVTSRTRGLVAKVNTQAWSLDQAQILPLALLAEGPSPPVSSVQRTWNSRHWLAGFVLAGQLHEFSKFVKLWCASYPVTSRGLIHYIRERYAYRSLGLEPAGPSVWLMAGSHGGKALCSGHRLRPITTCGNPLC